MAIYREPNDSHELEMKLWKLIAETLKDRKLKEMHIHLDDGILHINYVSNHETIRNLKSVMDAMGIPEVKVKAR